MVAVDLFCARQRNEVKMGCGIVVLKQENRAILFKVHAMRPERRFTLRMAKPAWPVILFFIFPHLSKTTS